MAVHLGLCVSYSKLRSRVASALRKIKTARLSQMFQDFIKAYLRLHKHQIDKQNHKIMLHVFIREPFTSRALRQPYISPRSPYDSLLSQSICRAARCASPGRFGGRVGRGTPLVAAMEDVVELGDGIAAFDADGHASTIYMMGNL